VTETALLDMPLAALSLARLRALGVQLALDDFGTGYSALSYLAELPFDIVKIDRSFIAGMSDPARGGPLLEAVLVLCQALKLITVAEGIEEPAQLSRLRALGCAFGQGYLLSRPVPAADIAALLAEKATARPRRRRARALTASVT
jgi:EAL domain-containing protein (putative c-di-GMP-specific phosphodiesterase class I)